MLGSTQMAIAELEGLAFVPAGRTFIGSFLDVGCSVDLLVDRYEVRYGLWEAWMGEDHSIPSAFRPGSRSALRSGLSGQDSAPPAGRVEPEAWTYEVPAVGITLDDARRVAAKRGMRLLTFEEWLWCAVGPTCRRVPSGRRQRGFANTQDAQLSRTTPVGAFESGQTPEGIYDLLGNVWEWVEPPPERLRTWTVLNEAAWPSGTAVRAPTWVLGGSFLTAESTIFTRDYTLMAMAVTTGQRSIEIGARCCVDADVFLAALPESAVLGGDERKRLRAVGARWGTRASSLCEEILQAQPQNGWVLALLEGIRGGTVR
ncbi:MAG: SUMF1/EgtB/PvdO family nonheme iron enzyme [Planctomycetota bacterium]